MLWQLWNQPYKWGKDEMMGPCLNQYTKFPTTNCSSLVYHGFFLHLFYFSASPALETWGTLRKFSPLLTTVLPQIIPCQPFAGTTTSFFWQAAPALWSIIVIGDCGILHAVFPHSLHIVINPFNTFLIWHQFGLQLLFCFLFSPLHSTSVQGVCKWSKTSRHVVCVYLSEYPWWQIRVIIISVNSKLHSNAAVHLLYERSCCGVFWIGHMCPVRRLELQSSSDLSCGTSPFINNFRDGTYCMPLSLMWHLVACGIMNCLRLESKYKNPHGEADLLHTPVILRVTRS